MHTRDSRSCCLAAELLNYNLPMPGPEILASSQYAYQVSQQFRDRISGFLDPKTLVYTVEALNPSHGFPCVSSDSGRPLWVDPKYSWKKLCHLDKLPLNDSLYQLHWHWRQAFPHIQAWHLIRLSIPPPQPTAGCTSLLPLMGPNVPLLRAPPLLMAGLQ